MNRRNAAIAVLGISFLAILLVTLLTTSWGAGDLNPMRTPELNEALGNQIFNIYGPVMFIAGLVLFVSLLGGVYLAQEEQE